MPEHRLVAVLRPRPGDQENRREGTLAVGEGERPGQLDSLFRVLVPDILRAVGKGTLRLLRSARALDPLHPLEPEREARPRLAPLPLDVVVADAQALVLAADRGDRETERVPVDLDAAHGDARRALVGAVQGGRQRAPLALLDVEDDPEPPSAGDLEGALPDPDGRFDRGRVAGLDGLRAERSRDGLEGREGEGHDRDRRGHGWSRW